MNMYAQYLAGTVDELRAFAATDEGRQWDSSWYDGVADLVDSVIEQNTDEEAENLLGMLMRRVVDSGPLIDRLAPSLQKAVDAMQRKQPPPRR